MAKRKIVWTETAAKQRREILKYWTERNKSATYAEKLIEITAKHLKVISKNPEAFKETEIDITKVPNSCEYYFYKDSKSKFGNAQRNFALDKIQQGYVYFNDDDTVIHPDLWTNIHNCSGNFISFIQNNSHNTLRLTGKSICIGDIDSHNFIVDINTIDNIRFNIAKYHADGEFAVMCYQQSKSFTYIPKVLSIYNSLKKLRTRLSKPSP